LNGCEYRLDISSQRRSRHHPSEGLNWSDDECERHEKNFLRLHSMEEVARAPRVELFLSALCSTQTLKREETGEQALKTIRSPS
jgi:hypothetical protein